MSQITVTKQEQKLNINQKLSLHTLQKRLQLLKLEEYLLLATFMVGGILGRTLLQGFPSVEPITFFAVLAGSLFGWKKGAATGASAWYLSNFFMFGGQGPWSIIHVLNGVVAGFLGGFLQKRAGYVKAVTAMVLATVFFELTMNISSGFFFGFGILGSFFSAIPFMIAHLASNIGLSFLLPGAKKLALEKGRLNEKEMCKEYIGHIKATQRHHET